MAVTVYCDEHFGPDIVNDFIHQGASIGLRAELFRTHKHRALDDEQHFFAAQQNWTILTRDADFRDLHVLWHVLGVWRRRRPALHHAGILWITSGQVKDRAVVPQVLALLTAPRPLQDELYVLRIVGTAVRWHAYRPFAAGPESPL